MLSSEGTEPQPEPPRLLARANGSAQEICMKTLTSSCMERSCSANSAPVADRKEPQRSLDSLAVIVTCHRGKEICSQGAAADHWPCVVSGVARGYVSRSDGRRKIVDLLLPGDFFGFTVGNEYDCAVEAVAEGTVIA